MAARTVFRQWKNILVAVGVCMLAPLGSSWALSSSSLFSIDTRPAELSGQIVTFSLGELIGVGGYFQLEYGASSYDISAVTIDDIDVTIGGTEYDLAASASGSTLGVSFPDPTENVIRFSTATALAPAEVIVELGVRATHQAAGVDRVLNPATAGTYPLTIAAYDVADVRQERTKVLAVVFEAVSVTAVDSTNPPSSGSAGGSTVSVPDVFSSDPSPGQCFQIGDLDGNCYIDLHDFSIAGFWESRDITGEDFFHLEALHLNGDGVIDLVDFSIMAYYYERR